MKQDTVLVGHNPGAVKAGIWLTDGADNFEVKEMQNRRGEPWVKLKNVTSPELEAEDWFRLQDILELGFYRRPGPTRRRYGVRRGRK